MFVCVCNSVSDKTIKRAIQDGTASSVDDLKKSHGVGACCGRCVDFAEEIVTEAHAEAASMRIADMGGVGVVTFG
ncbi:MAG: (2Fe-2S)-binding protein [Pontibacterium sp.]